MKNQKEIMEETKQNKITQFLNKKVLEDKMFDNQEYDQQFKKEIKEL
jgi:hypothetical protein